MATKINDVFGRNSSSNYSHASNTTTRKEYDFAPVSYPVKLTTFTALLLFGVYGFVANSLILYFKHKKHRRGRRSRGGPLARSLTEYFIKSLALSNLLSSLIGLPLFATQIVIDYIKTDSVCRFTRFFTVLFPTVTILNLLVIGVERYLAIFHPFFVLRQRKAKRMVVGAWILGILISLAINPGFKLVYYEIISDDSFTFVCKYHRSTQFYRALFIGFESILFLFPSFTLTFINIRILRRQRHSQHVEPSSANTREKALSRLKVTRMFVSLIFAFICPFMTLFLYTILSAVLKFHVSFAADYIVRHLGGLLMYANGLVSATILIHYEKLYLDFMSCFRSSVATSDDQRVQRVAQNNIVMNNKNDLCTPV